MTDVEERQPVSCCGIVRCSVRVESVRVDAVRDVGESALWDRIPAGELVARILDYYDDSFGTGRSHRVSIATLSG